MVLSKRLKTVAELIHPGSSVFDVGADHGQLEKYLLDNKLVKKIIAVENKKGPYLQLKSNLKGYPQVDILLSDGITDLPKETNVIVLAGLGGLKIVDILVSNKEKLSSVEQIVVDAHRDITHVRKEITKLGFKIEKEAIVFEKDIYYFVISFLKGEAKYDEDVLEFGYQIKNDKLFPYYKENFIKENELILSKLASSNKNEAKIKEIEEKIRRIENL